VVGIVISLNPVRHFVQQEFVEQVNKKTERKNERSRTQATNSRTAKHRAVCWPTTTMKRSLEQQAHFGPRSSKADARDAERSGYSKIPFNEKGGLNVPVRTLSAGAATATDHHPLPEDASTSIESGSALCQKRRIGTKKRSSVSFGLLHVHEFPVVLGDNPAVQFGGPPIRLDYATGPEDSTVLGVDEYERQRGDRRSLAELRVPATMRRQWVGRDRALERQVVITQYQRRRTANAKTEWDAWHYALERMHRGAVKKLGLRQAASQSPASQWCQQHKQEKQQHQQQQQEQQQQQKPTCRKQEVKKAATYNVSVPKIDTTARKKSRARQDITAFFV
jgi:hypothetical protein